MGSDFHATSAYAKIVFRAELTRKSQQIERLRAEMQIEKVDAEQMTDPVSIESSNLLSVVGSQVGLSATAPVSPAGSISDQQRLTKETLTQLEVYARISRQRLQTVFAGVSE